ncbi:hypothetical protein D3C77_359700 [compost metagenome]
MFSHFIWQAKHAKPFVVTTESRAFDSVPVFHEAKTDHLKGLIGMRLQRWIGEKKTLPTSTEILASLSQLHGGSMLRNKAGSQQG